MVSTVMPSIPFRGQNNSHSLQELNKTAIFMSAMRTSMDKMQRMPLKKCYNSCHIYAKADNRFVQNF